MLAHKLRQIEYQYGAGTAAAAILGFEAEGIIAAFGANQFLVRSEATPSLNYFDTIGNAVSAGKLTLTRATSGWGFGPTGTLDEFTSGVPRLVFDPATLAPQGVLIESTRTRLNTYPNDFSNGAWAKTNLTAAFTATGITGVPNSASTLTATAANATALQSITSASAARISSVYIKRRTGTGVVQLTQDNGGTWATVSVGAQWARANSSSVTATNPTVGIRIVTSGDEIDVCAFQHELGAFVTSPILGTEGSQVTRDSDDCSVPVASFPFDAINGTLLAGGFTDQPATLTGSFFTTLAALYLSLTQSLMMCIPSSSFARLYYNGTTLGNYSSSPPGSIAAGVSFKWASSYDASGCYNALNGVANPDIVTASSLAGVTSLRVGRSSGGYLFGAADYVGYFARRASAAQLVARSS